MRASPIGLFRTINEVIDNATLQAKLTHDTEAGVQAAVASALMTHYFAYGLGAKKNLGDFLASHVEGPWQIPYEGEVGNVGWQVVQAAVTAIRRTNSLRQLLKNCISFSGDTDTIAVVALSAASFSSEFAYDLPSQLFDGLENATYGRDYIMEVEFKLLRSQGFAPHWGGKRVRS